MSELAVPEQQAVPAVTQPPQVVAVQSNSIAEWAREADLAYQLAQKLATTSFVPSTMRGRVDDIAGCIIAGKELGFSPMAALKSMDVIKGTPALRAHAMRALVQSHGHEIELVESTPSACRMRGRRKGAEQWQEVVWTLGRAQLMGLLEKSEWKKQPQGMLVARATGEMSRLLASDALHGVPYNAEELRDSSRDWTAVQVRQPVTAAEILGRPEPVAEVDPAPQMPTAAEPGSHAAVVAEFYTAIEVTGADREAVLQQFWDEHGAGPEEAATHLVQQAIDSLTGASD